MHLRLGWDTKAIFNWMCTACSLTLSVNLKRRKHAPEKKCHRKVTKSTSFIFMATCSQQRRVFGLFEMKLITRTASLFSHRVKRGVISVSMLFPGAIMGALRVNPPPPPPPPTSFLRASTALLSFKAVRRCSASSYIYICVCIYLYVYIHIYMCTYVYI